MLQTVSREGKLEGARASLLPLGNGRIAPPAEPCDGMEMEFGQAQPVVPVTANAFGGLSTLERRTLADWIAAARKGVPILSERHVFPGSRDNVRLEAVAAAIRLLHRQIDA